jgi:hypothetical protein
MTTTIAPAVRRPAHQTTRRGGSPAAIRKTSLRALAVAAHLERSQTVSQPRPATHTST